MQSEWVSSREGAGSEGPLVNSRQRILVADDHKPMLDSLVRLLSDEFDVVAAVGDGLAAVTQAQQLKPDLLVLDIAMPGMNGIAAAARLKAGGSKAKVVFVSNMRDREFVEKTLALGDIGFVVKDRLVADLVPAIHQVLGGEAFVSPSIRR
jgi:DNA-binding NarL/FixJ family response regulator